MLENAYTELFPYEAYWFTVASFAKVFTVAITRVYNNCFSSQGCQIFPVAYGQNPDDKMANMVVLWTHYDQNYKMFLRW